MLSDLTRHTRLRMALDHTEAIEIVRVLSPRTPVGPSGTGGWENQIMRKSRFSAQPIALALCSPSAGCGPQTLLSLETQSGVCDPKERVEMSNQKKQTSEAAIREIRRRTRRKFSPEEKIRIVLEGHGYSGGRNNKPRFPHRRY